jgi:hypothetical protein
VNGDLDRAVARDLGRTEARRAVEVIADNLARGESVDAVAEAPRGRVVAATDQRLAVGDRNGQFWSVNYEELRDVVPLPLGKQAVVCPLVEGQPFEGIEVRRRDARRVADAAHARIVVLHSSREAGRWHDDPAFAVAARFAPVALLVSPPKYPIPGKTWVSLSIVTTGIQITPMDQAKLPGKEFVAWDGVSRLETEGVDQVTRRPRVGAVLAFGVLGLAASRKEKCGYIALATDAGDFVLQVNDLLPTEIRATLMPAVERLRQLSGDSSPGVSDPVDQIKRLASLRDEGAITTEEFEAKKKDLLGRI